MFERRNVNILLNRLGEPRRFMQVLTGPRQTGKTTIARQVMQKNQSPTHYASADEPALKDRFWIEQQWEAARAQSRSSHKEMGGVLVLDEIQKIPGWSETVKRLWDEDTENNHMLHVILLGSSALLVQQGLTESLAGRFEMIHVTHWSFEEMKTAFGWNVEDYIFYGGYPGAAELIGDHQRWSNYIKESLIETTISRDILLMTRVDKPALLRQLFQLGCNYSSQILSYQKMLGQLQDAGNTTTLAHYLHLLQQAGLIAGLQKYAGQRVRQRASSPKLLALNTALMSASKPYGKEEAVKDTDYWGRLVESAIGQTLANGISGQDIELFYWLSRNREVDYVLCRGHRLVAIEVKSGCKKGFLPGIAGFSKEFDVWKKLLVGPNGIPLDEFMRIPPEEWFD